MKELDAEGELVRKNGMLYRKIRYKGGTLRLALWDDVELSSSSEERTGYPTQKPVALYKRIIAASSNEGDIVLDPFCVCSTTLVAAEALKRHWIGIDLWEGAATTLQERIESPVYTRGTPREPTKKRMSALTCRASIGGSAKPNLGCAYITPICARYSTPRGAAYARDAGGSFTFGLCS